jgi:nucleotide-binding universal stress UspA family protein
MWSKICCPVDFSEVSRRALREGARLALRDGAPLTVLHVLAPVRTNVMAADMLAFVGEPIEPDPRPGLEAQLAEWKRDAEAIAPGIAVDTMLVTGWPEERIAELVRAHHFDLVVIGTHGRTGVKRLVLGSVAERVVREAPASVLVYREPPEAAPPGDR